MYKQIGKVSLYYEEFGSGTPVICIHGFGVDSMLMKGSLEPFFEKRNGFRRIYPDLIGMGNTAASESVRNSDDVLKTISAFINDTVGDDDFILIGESFGGYLSLGIMEQFKEKILGMFLICPCTIADHQKRILPKHALIEKTDFPVDENDKEDYKSFLDMAVVVSPYTFARYKKEILPGLKKADQTYLNSLDKKGYTLSAEESIRKTEFAKPSVFLLGKQDNIVGYEDALKLEPNFIRGSFAVIDGAGHNLQIEKPEIFDVFLEVFLKSLKI